MVKKEGVQNHKPVDYGIPAGICPTMDLRKIGWNPFLVNEDYNMIISSIFE